MKKEEILIFLFEIEREIFKYYVNFISWVKINRAENIYRFEIFRSKVEDSIFNINDF